MTQTILLSCPPNTTESSAALNYCLKQALQHSDITCVFFVGHGVAHAFEQLNTSLSEWQNLCATYHISLYCCAHSIDQLVASNTAHHNSTPQNKDAQLKKPFQTAGLGILVEACINSSAVISFAPQNMPCTLNGSASDTVNTDTAVINDAGTRSQHISAARQETGKPTVFHLHSHDIMCHVTMSALFNIALVLLIFEQEVTIHLQKSKTNKQDNANKINANSWIRHNASALANVKGMGMNSITLDECLTSQLATPLRDLDLCVTASTDITANTSTTKHNGESKSIYI